MALNRFVKSIDDLADEGHRSELIAGYYHLGFVVLYVGALLFHAWGSHRHFRDAKKEKSV